MAINIKKSLSNKQIGHLGEDIATKFLIENGYTVLTRNYRTRWGEIDIVVTKGSIIYCVEVKARSSIYFGMPSDAITPQKLRRMQLMAQIYAQNINLKGSVKLLLVEVLQGKITLIEIE